VPDYSNSVFINCPFDNDYAPLLEAILFCIVRADLFPRLSSERLEAGENRLDKITVMISECQFSIHDLSLSRAREAGEVFRMNMPFELGMDMGWRRAPDVQSNDKKFLIFEKEPYELKRSLSDLAGTDIAWHNGDYQRVIRALRDFLVVEAQAALPGPTLLESEYQDFLGWMTEKKVSEGHTEDEALNLPTAERLNELITWRAAGMPIEFED
jgi:hypothetical protein